MSVRNFLIGAAIGLLAFAVAQTVMPLPFDRAFPIAVIDVLGAGLLYAGMRSR